MSQKIKILTGQYVRINYTAAGLGRRMGSLFIDYIAMIVLYLAFWGGSVWIYMENTTFRRMFNSNLDLSWIVVALIIILIGFTKPIMEYFNHGKSIGKICTGTAVVMRNGSAPTLSACMLRHILLTVDQFFWGVPAIIAYLNSKDKQRIGDLAAGTVVVLTSLSGAEKVSLSNDFKYLNDRYKVRYPEVEKLSQSDIEEIGSALFKKGRPDNTSRKIGETAIKYKKQLGLKVNPGTPADEFLHKLWNDYYFLQLNS